MNRLEIGLGLDVYNISGFGFDEVMDISESSESDGNIFLE